MLALLVACATEPVTLAGGGSDDGGDALRDDDGGRTNDTGAEDSGDTGAEDTWDTADEDDEGGTGDWSDVESRTYGFGIGDGRVVEPENGGSLIEAGISQLVLFSVLDFRTDTIDAVGAMSVDDTAPIEQDWCVPSFAFPGSQFDNDNGRFFAGPADLAIFVSGSRATIEQTYISGEFDGDLEEFDQGTLDGYLETTGLDEAIGGIFGDTGLGAACRALATVYGVDCEACPSSGTDYCVHVRVEDVEAPWIEGLELVEVFGTNCEDCERTPPAEDAVCE
jgi:hypothetical protein